MKSKIAQDIELDFNVTASQQEIKDNLTISIFSDEKFGALFNRGHLSKMSSMVKVSELLIDYTYQRSPIKAKVNKIAKNFDPDLLGVIICSMRESGVVAVIDGSHRVHALLQKGLKDSVMNALVYFDLTIEEEAKIFALMNQEHTKPNPAEIFKAGVVAGDQETIEINNIINKLGLKIGVGPGDNKLRAISTVKRVYRNAGGNVLFSTLSSIKQAYGDSSAVMRDVLISAVAIVFNRYGDQVDIDRMVNTLRKFGNPTSLIANAQSMMNGRVNQVTTTALPFMIVNSYNSRLTKNRLADYPMNLLPQQVWVKQ